MVSYKIREEVNNIDLTQTRNISEKGMMLTTSKAFPENTLLSISVKLPFITENIKLEGKVVAAREISKNLVYATHICFLENIRDILARINKREIWRQIIEWGFKKEKG